MSDVQVGCDHLSEVTGSITCDTIRKSSGCSVFVDDVLRLSINDIPLEEPEVVKCSVNVKAFELLLPVNAKTNGVRPFRMQVWITTINNDDLIQRRVRLRKTTWQPRCIDRVRYRDR